MPGRVADVVGSSYREGFTRFEKQSVFHNASLENLCTPAQIIPVAGTAEPLFYSPSVPHHHFSALLFTIFTQTRCGQTAWHVERRADSERSELQNHGHTYPASFFSIDQHARDFYSPEDCPQICPEFPSASRNVTGRFRSSLPAMSGAQAESCSLFRARVDGPGLYP